MHEVVVKLSAMHLGGRGYGLGDIETVLCECIFFQHK